MSPNWLQGLFSRKNKPDDKAEVSAQEDLSPSIERSAPPRAVDSTSYSPPDNSEGVADFAPPEATAANFPLDFSPGQHVEGLFTILRSIGQGMLFKNYLARQERWNTEILLKVPQDMVRHNPKCLQYLARTAETWNGLGLHPNIVYCHRVLQIDQTPVLVVEYLDGGNLRDWIAEGWCADLKLGLDLALQFCHALEYAHRQGVIHRALKPENVVLQRDGILKVTDFGMTITESNPELLEQYHLLAGQAHDSPLQSSLPPLPYYLAPEQLREGHFSDFRADLFAYGVCLYEMFCGRAPYHTTLGSSQYPPDPRVMRGDDNLPQRLCRLMPRCVEWDHNRRPSGMAEIRKELNEIYVDLFRQPSAFAQPPLAGPTSDSEENPRFPWLQIEQGETDEENNRAVALLVQGKEEEALDHFQRILASGRPSLEASYNHSLLLWRRGQLDDRETVNRLERLAASPGIKPKALSTALAEVQMERCDPAAAKAALKDFPALYTQLFSGRESPAMETLHVLRGHSKSGSAVALTPDGRRGLSGSNDHSLRLWNLQSGKTLHTVDLGTSGACTVALAGDGTIGLADAQKTIKLWNIETGHCLRSFEGHTNYVMAVAMTPDGRKAISGGWDRTLRTWEVSTGECLSVLEGHGNYITAVALTPDGRLALSASWDHTLRLWDLMLQRCLTSLRGHENYVISVGITPDAQLGVSGSTDKTVRVWDLSSAKCLRVLTGHTSWVDAVAISADGRWAFSGSKDKTLKIWDLTTGQCLRTLEGHSGGIASIAITPDGRMGLSGSQDSTLRLWTLNPALRRQAQFKTTQAALPYPSAPVTLSPKATPPPSSAPVAAPAPARSPSAIDIPTVPDSSKISPPIKKEESSSPPSPPERVKQPLNPKNSLPPVAASDLFSPADTHHAEQDPEYKKIELHISQHQFRQAFECLFRSWSSKKFRADRQLEEAYLRLKPEGRPVQLEQAIARFHIKGLGSRLVVAIAKNGQFGLSGGENKEVKVWDLGSGKCLQSLEGHRARIIALAATADGRQAMSSDIHHAIMVWNLESGQCLRSLERVSPLAVKVVLASDGRRGIAIGEDNTAQFWDLKLGQCLTTLAGHQSAVTSVAITSDGQRGISGSEDHTAIFWDLESGKNLHSLLGHAQKISAVALSADGKVAATGSLDQTLRIWDPSSGNCLRTLELNDPVCSIALNSEASGMLTSQENGTLTNWLLLWKLEFDA
jgi:WD40 repeat protein/serine/threonine protein kinase